MKCHNCGGTLEEIITDLPFKIGRESIVIIKKLPLLQCQNCSEYLIEDNVMKGIDRVINGVDNSIELEILSYSPK
ncbi:MAG: YgiT-type zinc finger protein [Candidatus Magnetobacterium sp. LHC-1]|uniref:YgiT-type zinc finger protein n=1 Tax=Candidatus Magnetobacterium casense TaxID=1455061 RepID=A0ABS6RU73_9BACT|nr:YgiT-type zinc finger protein [Candidatus Magnetobacterium casensis]MBF0606627.1 YgiT-type zinc finger protein [Nitrospirota bacterium]MBV6339997.1 YgiT-type zinc finger protein [Candidatus Magnetobacterium casensis]